MALTVNFALPRLMPGNPLELMMGKLGAKDSGLWYGELARTGNIPAS